jgi:hypothetical protein
LLYEGLEAERVPNVSCMPRNEGLLALRRDGIRVSGTPPRGALATKVIELVPLALESDYDRAGLIDPQERASPRHHATMASWLRT